MNGYKIQIQMKELTDEIRVFIRPEDFKNTDYRDTQNCALAMTLKREGYELTSYGVGGFMAIIQNVHYLIDNYGHEVRRGYDGKYPNGLEVVLTRI